MPELMRVPQKIRGKLVEGTIQDPPGNACPQQSDTL
jgi:hypothetical protein